VNATVSKSDRRIVDARMPFPRHMNKRRLPTVTASSFEKVQGPYGIHFEVIKWDQGSAIVGWLCCRVNNDVRFQLLHIRAVSVTISVITAI
jgi:hypothetical protein